MNFKKMSFSLFIPFRFECRDFDAAETVPEKINKVKSLKGVRGLVKLAKEIAITATHGNHDNEYIGETRIPLKVSLKRLRY